MTRSSIRHSVSQRISIWSTNLDVDNTLDELEKKKEHLFTMQSNIFKSNFVWQKRSLKIMLLSILEVNNCALRMTTRQVRIKGILYNASDQRANKWATVSKRLCNSCTTSELIFRCKVHIGDLKFWVWH